MLRCYIELVIQWNGLLVRSETETRVGVQMWWPQMTTFSQFTTLPNHRSDEQSSPCILVSFNRMALYNISFRIVYIRGNSSWWTMALIVALVEIRTDEWRPIKAVTCRIYICRLKVRGMVQLLSDLRWITTTLRHAQEIDKIQKIEIISALFFCQVSEEVNCCS